MEFLDDLQRAFFGALYTFRIPVAIGSIAVALAAIGLAHRLGWLAAARRHPARSGLVLAAGLAVGLPLAWYLASPIWIRTALVEPEPAIEVVATPTVPPADPGPTLEPTLRPQAPSSSPGDPVPPTTTPFESRTIAEGEFQGTDDFHFGRGTARIIETAPGEFTLRLSDFSVQNGPDLFVLLSPAADDYARGSLELGRLKATDGAFGYRLPDGTDPTEFRSAIIWCKQFSHLFAFATLAPR